MSQQQMPMGEGAPPGRGALNLPRGYQRARCKYGCQHPVMWAKLVDALGKPKINQRTKRQSMVLINLGTVHDGNVVLEGAGRARVLSPREYRDDTTDLFEVHRRTCTNNPNKEAPAA